MISFTEFSLSPIARNLDGSVRGWRVKGSGDTVTFEGLATDDRVYQAAALLADVLNERLQQQQGILGTVDDDESNVP